MLTEAVGRPRGTLVVRSQPEGADVWMNGKVYGQTPLKQPVWAGTYPLVLLLWHFVALRCFHIEVPVHVAVLYLPSRLHRVR